MAAQKWGAGTHQCGAETTMLRRSGALESTIAALEPQLCTRVGVWRPAKRRWNRNAAQVWGAGTHNCSAGAAMLHRRGALEPTIAPPLEPQCCTGVARRSPPVRRWGRNAAYEWALEPANVPLEPQCCTRVGR